MGDAFPDIANASRPMKKSEFDACAAKGVKDIVADQDRLRRHRRGHRQGRRRTTTSRPSTSTWAWPRTCCAGGKFVANPYKTWDEIGAGLPGNRILVYGPPPTSGTRDAFVELGIEAGARKFPTADALRSDNEKKFKELADPLRKDGWVDAGENDNAIVGTLTKTPGSLGVFGYSFLEENLDKIKGASVNGVKPTPSTIADGSYPLSRSLYIYVKKASIGVTRACRNSSTSSSPTRPPAGAATCRTAA